VCNAATSFTDRVVFKMTASFLLALVTVADYAKHVYEELN